MLNRFAERGSQGKMAKGWSWGSTSSKDAAEAPIAIAVCKEFQTAMSAMIIYVKSLYSRATFPLASMSLRVHFSRTADLLSE